MLPKINWLTRQGYTTDQIDQIVTEENKKDAAAVPGAKAAAEAAAQAAVPPEQASVKAGADAAKSLLGGIGAAVGKAAAAAEASVAAAAAAGKDPSTDGKLPEQQRRPKFVKHINKTRTMSGKQKWDWAFDKILMVSLTPLFSIANFKANLKAGF